MMSRPIRSVTPTRVTTLRVHASASGAAIAVLGAGARSSAVTPLNSAPMPPAQTSTQLRQRARAHVTSIPPADATTSSAKMSNATPIVMTRATMTTAAQPMKRQARAKRGQRVVPEIKQPVHAGADVAGGGVALAVHERVAETSETPISRRAKLHRHLRRVTLRERRVG